MDLSWQEPQRAHRNNLTATLAVIAAAKAARIPRIVFASSAATYGNAASPVRESQVGNPLATPWQPLGNPLATPLKPL